MSVAAEIVPCGPSMSLDDVGAAAAAARVAAARGEQRWRQQWQLQQRAQQHEVLHAQQQWDLVIRQQPSAQQQQQAQQHAHAALSSMQLRHLQTLGMLWQQIAAAMPQMLPHAAAPMPPVPMMVQPAPQMLWAQQPQQPAAAPQVVDEADGVKLHHAPGTKTGYKGVQDQGERSDPAKRYRAKRCREGKMLLLGSFPTAVEAAVCYARSLL